MKITWIGQGGFFLRCDNGAAIMIDPYLSDSLEWQNGPDWKRIMPIKEEFLKQEADILICTHDHIDHTDPQTIKRLFSQPKIMSALLPKTVWKHARLFNYYSHNLIQFDCGTEVTLSGALFKAVHSDPSAIGVVIKADNVKLYITGDTLYNEEIFSQIGADVDILSICINGVGNNMNITDAYRFTQRVNPKVVIPMHWGMFAKFTADPVPFMNMFNATSIRPCQLQPFQEYRINDL